jgi:ATP-dependent helicase HrpA
MADWPVDPRLARIILEGHRLGCVEDMLVLGAALSIQDPRERPLEARQAADEAHARFSDERSDFSGLLKLWQHLRSRRRALTSSGFRKLCQREFLAFQRVLEWFDLYQQLRDLAREQRLPLTGQHGDYEVLHKALLSGLLSQVGQKRPEDHSYLGARNRSFHIFPGSGLFGRGPPWIMSAEVVETSKPYARTNAQVEPAWIEAQGAHMIRRTHLDPHWSRKRGRVLAWEQVSLFGLLLAERRRVAFDAVDPAAAREIFIREALVRGELDTRAGFQVHNQNLRQEVERLEHKRRQRDVLVDERVLEDFFAARLPGQVNSARSLERWLESLGEAGLERLQLAHDVLFRDDAGDAPGERFPDHLQAGGQ